MRMQNGGFKKFGMHVHGLMVLALLATMLSSGCQEAQTIKKELVRKFWPKLSSSKPFTPRDGITFRPCSLYQAANENSEVLRKLPAETPVSLVDSVGEWYRVRTRDGREGYLKQKAVGGQDIIAKTNELRKSIEGMPPQAEGITKSRANFRLDPGIGHQIIEKLPPGKKFEVYERVVTLRGTETPDAATRGRNPAPNAVLEETQAEDSSTEGAKKDVWYKVKIEDGRVGYLYTHNMKLTPPEDIERAVNFMRLVAWRTVNTRDDPDQGAKSNYIVAYAPIARDPGCDYTRLYFMTWDTKQKKRIIRWQLSLAGILPVTNYHFEGKPGFSVRFLHPTKKDKLVLASYVLAKGRVKKVSEEEIPNSSVVH
jgi:hypothetical protein